MNITVDIQTHAPGLTGGRSICFFFSSLNPRIRHMHMPLFIVGGFFALQ
ncbi:hypothetical protein [Diaphorobacter caeni]|nr:hypothetical protein [Diaphorobacter caeni]MBF5007488.1 hypothetical protein [Diaphorobacter caeni]